MKKPVICTWALGPSYRNRLNQNVNDAINSGYSDICEYIILTDKPSDFDEIRLKTSKIIDVINIHEVRKDYPWSIKVEPVPEDPDNYGKIWRENYDKGLYMHYSTHRFSFPRISELGYTKFFFCDPDVWLRYDKIVNGIVKEEDFWGELDTPTHSMKGGDAEIVEIKIADSSFHYSPCAGYVNYAALQAASIGIDRLNNKYGTDVQPFVNQLAITEGPTRLYHFNTPEDVKKYFEIWNDVVHMWMVNTSTSIKEQVHACGGYVWCDYITVATVNRYLGINVKGFSKPPASHEVRIYWEDRYFMPKPINFKHHNGFQGADTIEEWFQINKEIIDDLESTEHSPWPYMV